MSCGIAVSTTAVEVGGAEALAFGCPLDAGAALVEVAGLAVEVELGKSDETVDGLTVPTVVLVVAGHPPNVNTIGTSMTNDNDRAKRDSLTIWSLPFFCKLLNN